MPSGRSRLRRTSVPLEEDRLLGAAVGGGAGELDEIVGDEVAERVGVAVVVAQPEELGRGEVALRVPLAACVIDADPHCCSRCPGANEISTRVRLLKRPWCRLMEVVRRDWCAVA